MSSVLLQCSTIFPSRQQENQKVHSKFVSDAESRLFQKLRRRKCLQGTNSDSQSRHCELFSEFKINRNFPSIIVFHKMSFTISNCHQTNYHLAIKFDNPDEIKLSIVGSFSKTRIDSGEDLVLELEFRPLLSFRKESVDRRYEICISIVNGSLDS
jgi:hypothetical protein